MVSTAASATHGAPAAPSAVEDVATTVVAGERDSAALSRIAAEAAASKKGDRTVVLEVGHLLRITDYFVITSGANPRHVRSLADEIEKKVKAAGYPGPAGVEGLDDARWVLLDFGDFVCHVFLDEARAYYDIERLWSDAPRTEYA